MILTSWLRAVFDRRRKSPRSNSRSLHTIELGLVRLEDRRVLSVSGGEVMLFSVGGTTGLTLPDVGPVQASDIVSFDATRPAGEQFALVFDGEDVGIGSAAIDAIAWAGDNQFLFSFASTTTIAGLGTFNGSDILLFQADSLGENTAGTFSVVLRGSDIGLAPTPGNIDALDILEDGTLVFSTAGDVTLPAGINGASITVQDDDLVQLTPDAAGHFATGTMRVFFDGADAGLTVSTEDIDAVSIDGSQVRISTVGSFFIETQGGLAEAGMMC